MRATRATIRRRARITIRCARVACCCIGARSHGVEVGGDPEGFGITTTVVLPGDLEVMLEEPGHRTAI